MLLSMSTASAWGVLPARQLGAYDDTNQQFSFDLRNTELEEGYFQVNFGGELAQYASYSGAETIFFQASNREKTIPIQLELQTGALEPGRNRLRVIFSQVPGQSDVTVGASVTLVGEIIVDVPYDRNFVEASLYTQPSRSNEPTPFQISLVNKGQEAISVHADMVIKGPTNEVIHRWSTSPFILDYQDAEKIRTTWDGKKEPGTYAVEATVMYGQDSRVLQKTFSVGSREVAVQSLTADRFRLGEINQMTLQAKNTWNEQLEDVYAEVFVVDNSGNVVQSFTTNPQTIPAFQTTELEGYWDTQGLEVGDYTLNVITHAEDDNSQYSFPVEVDIDDVSVATGNVAATDDQGSTDSLIIIILIAVVISNIVLIWYFKKKR